MRAARCTSAASGAGARRSSSRRPRSRRAGPTGPKGTTPPRRDKKGAWRKPGTPKTRLIACVSHFKCQKCLAHSTECQKCSTVYSVSESVSCTLSVAFLDPRFSPRSRKVLSAVGGCAASAVPVASASLTALRAFSGLCGCRRRRGESAEGGAERERGGRRHGRADGLRGPRGMEPETKAVPATVSTQL